MTESADGAGMPEGTGGVRTKLALGVDRLVLQIHAASFPSEPEEDLGRGSPYSRGAERLFMFAARLGFDAIQLGPMGMTARGNPSPYDATIFSRNPLDLPLARLVDEGRLERSTWEQLRRSLPQARDGVIPYPTLFDAFQAAVKEIAARATAADREAARSFLASEESWLVPDALYEFLCLEHGNPSWREWSHTTQGAFDQRLFAPPAGAEPAAAARLRELRARHSVAIEDYALVQWLLAVEHKRLRERLARLGLFLFGDLQVGLSERDVWARRHLLLPGYRMGAPPSRTNPRGQPWGYGVLDPAQFGTSARPGAALRFVREWVRKLSAECDGVRIDHPHGWVDPWVYRADDPDPFHAVQCGARLRSSPDDPRHPALAPLAIARADQIDRAQPRHADSYVRELDGEQAARYSTLMDALVAEWHGTGGAARFIAAEVLSTLPYTVARVLARHGLGRFRVTQKAQLDDPADVYRIENAADEDWLMLSTHDTPPIWRVAEEWSRAGEGLRWGRYLAGLLARESEAEAVASRVTADKAELIHALLAAMFAGRARRFVVFFADLFGLTARYNEPGVVNDTNWTLRVPPDFADAYERRRGRSMIDVARCMEWALASARRGSRGGPT